MESHGDTLWGTYTSEGVPREAELTQNGSGTMLRAGCVLSLVNKMGEIKHTEYSCFSFYFLVVVV